VVGVIFTEKGYATLQQVEKGLDFADRFNTIYTPDYTTAHSLLVACADSNAAAPIKSFEMAVELLNNGKSAAEIYTLLSKVQRFKALLPAIAPKSVFAMPVSVNILKRSQPEDQNKEENPSPAKKTGNITSFYKAVPKVSPQKEEAKSANECLTQHGADRIVVVISEHSVYYKCWMCPESLVFGG